MKQMKRILLVALAAVAQPVIAQTMFPSYIDSAIHRSQLEIDGVAELGATSLKREFFSTLLFGGFIDDAMKGRSFSHHGEVNRLGLNVNAEVRYIHGSGRFLKRDTVTWMVKGGYTTIGNFVYGQDVFGLAFYGNEAYLNDKALLTNTRLDVMQFQKIGFGIVSKKDKSSITLNVINVQNYVDGYIRKGSLTQNEDGSEVELDIHGDLKTTTGSAFNKGIGLGLDVDYRLRVPWGKTTTSFQILVQNIGLAYMYDGLKSYSVDSTYEYSGFDFDQLTSGSELFGDDFSLLDSLNIEHKTVKKLVGLPGYIQVMKMVDPESVKPVQSFFGIRMYPTFNSVPQLFAGVYWKTTEFFHVSASLTYGGFSGIRGGLFLTLNRQQWMWMLGTEDIFGSISDKGYSESLVTRLIWKFGK